MLQAHSFLWHYMWLAPHILQLGLAIFLFRRRYHKRFPVFLAYIIVDAVEELTLYGLDMLPSISAQAWWRAYWIVLITEGLVKFAVVGELFRLLLHSWPALAKTGNRLLTGAGTALMLVAAVVAAYTTPENPYWIIGGALLLTQTLYLIQCGLILFLFLFAAYFKLSWDRSTFGIALGFGVLFCQRVATWALTAGIDLPNKGVLLSFVNMGTFHICVLIWFYYLLIPQKVVTTSAVPLPEHSLDIWNRELERLLQQ